MSSDLLVIFTKTGQEKQTMDRHQQILQNGLLEWFSYFCSERLQKAMSK